MRNPYRSAPLRIARERIARVRWRLFALVCVISFVAGGVADAYPPWNGTGAQNTWTAAGSSPALNPTWSVAAWWIDPVNGSDANTGQSSGSPFKTWHHLNDQVWGCLGSPRGCPRLQQSTTITFLSSHSDNSDPVYFYPAIENGTTIIQGTTPTTVATVSLAGTVAKSRAAGSNSLLQETLGASGAVAQLVENTTHSSRAWVYKSLGANAFSMTQPMAKQTAGGSTSPAEVDTWANTDSANLLTPVSVNIAAVEPIVEKGLTGIVGLFQLRDFSPTGAGLDWLSVGGPNVFMQECDIRRLIFVANTNMFLAMGNVLMSGGIELSANSTINGGASSGTAIAFNITNGANAVQIDGDFILGLSSGTSFWGSSGSMGVGFMYLDAPLQVMNGWFQHENLSYGGHVIYGSGTNTIDMKGASHLTESNGATFVASFTAPGLVTGIKINGNTTASCHTAADPDVIHSATTTPAHLDAACGAGTGLGSDAFIFGGASVSTL